jgi:hypothetical protein
MNQDVKEFKISIDDRQFIFETGKLAGQAGVQLL